MHIVLLAFRARTGGEPKALDVRDWKWAGVGELGGFDWAEADIPIVRKLMEGR